MESDWNQSLSFMEIKMNIQKKIAEELKIKEWQVESVIKLIDEGNTIPFIARYRKEAHGSLDDEQLRNLSDRLTYLRNLDQRRQEVKKAVDGQGKLTPELSAAIDAAATLAEVEDLYRPYKQTRRTRATVAREKGLEPLAQLLYHSPEAGFYLEILAPAMPLMYLESMVDGAMKGVGEQKAAFRYSVWDAVLRLAGVAVLLPRYGMRGFLAVMLLSTLYTCAANTGRLLLSSGTGHAFRRWLGAPLLAAAAAGAAGRGVRRALAGFPAQELAGQLAVLTAGGTVTAIVFLLAALPLGLWEEVRTVLRQAKTGKNRGK